jgi:hypothetical protein
MTDPERPESTFYTTTINGQTVVVERVPPAYAAGRKGVKQPRVKRNWKTLRYIPPPALPYPELAEEEELPAGNPPLPRRVLRAAKRAKHREPLELLENNDIDHFHLDYSYRGQKKQRDEISYTRGSWASGWNEHTPK